MKYLFGPVLSRRLGLSLGVDMVPYKYCSFDCIYCECGPTTVSVVKRHEYVKSDEIIREVSGFLDSSPELDFVTLAGSGEPTLNASLGKIINHIKDEYPSYDVALLTNASLLADDAVIEEVKRCDVILPSLDAVSETNFKKINRPGCGLKINTIIEGLKKIRARTQCRIWLEVFIVPGINDTDAELRLLKDEIFQINPHKIQLNTLDRPCSGGDVRPVQHERMLEISSLFHP
ncbi:radical SAM protein, partial [Elusimicrobiota bacterium]